MLKSICACSRTACWRLVSFTPEFLLPTAGLQPILWLRGPRAGAAVEGGGGDGPTAGRCDPKGCAERLRAAQARLHVTCENPAPSPPTRSLPGGPDCLIARELGRQSSSCNPSILWSKLSLVSQPKNSLYGPTQHRAEGRTLVGDGLWRVGNSSTSELPVELSKLLILGFVPRDSNTVCVTRSSSILKSLKSWLLYWSESRIITSQQWSPNTFLQVHSWKKNQLISVVYIKARFTEWCIICFKYTQKWKF